MRFVSVALLAFAVQDGKKDLSQASDRMDRLKSYRYTLAVILRGEEKLKYEGEYVAPGLFHSRFGEVEVAQFGTKKLVKTKDGDWEEPKASPRRRQANEPTPPHQWVRKLADMAPALKKEKSDKIGNTTVDIYVHSLLHNEARKALEAGGLPLWANAADWTKTKSGVLFYLGRSNDLVYRVEQRFSGRTRAGAPLDNKIVIDFSDHNRARCKLSKEVRDRLGVKAR